MEQVSATKGPAGVDYDQAVSPLLRARSNLTLCALTDQPKEEARESGLQGAQPSPPAADSSAATKKKKKSKVQNIWSKCMGFAVPPQAPIEAIAHRALLPEDP